MRSGRPARRYLQLQRAGARLPGVRICAIGAVLGEMPVYRTQAESFPTDEQSQRRLLRSLMNVRPLDAAAGASRACRAGQNNQGLQSACQICAAHSRADRGGASNTAGQESACRLLPLLSGAGRGAGTCQRSVLLYFHRGVPLPQSGSGRNCSADG